MASQDSDLLPRVVTAIVLGAAVGMFFGTTRGIDVTKPNPARAPRKPRESFALYTLVFLNKWNKEDYLGDHTRTVEGTREGAEEYARSYAKEHGWAVYEVYKAASSPTKRRPATLLYVKIDRSGRLRVPQGEAPTLRLLQWQIQNRS